ncbi:class C sortase [Pseudolactococcus yaeyamensis]
MSRKNTIFLSVTFLFFGILVFTYPSLSNWWNTRRMLAVSTVYDNKVNGLDNETKRTEWQKAIDYNNSLSGNPVKDPFVAGSGTALPKNYLDVLNIGGVMGAIEIPKIKVKLPLFHGTSDEVLEKGVGHLEGSSFPIGGLGTHALLSGHTGLPSAKLFTDLIRLKEGDIFKVNVLDEQLVYKVDSISVVNPEDISKLFPDVKKDYVTLITCTPYGINSHRLLVRGERVYQLDETIEVVKKETYLILILLVVLTNALLLILTKIIYHHYKKKYLREL